MNPPNALRQLKIPIRNRLGHIPIILHPHCLRSCKQRPAINDPRQRVMHRELQPIMLELRRGVVPHEHEIARVARWFEGIETREQALPRGEAGLDDDAHLCDIEREGRARRVEEVVVSSRTEGRGEGVQVPADEEHEGAVVGKEDDDDEECEEEEGQYAGPGLHSPRGETHLDILLRGAP